MWWRIWNWSSNAEASEDTFKEKKTTSVQKASRQKIARVEEPESSSEPESISKSFEDEIDIVLRKGGSKKKNKISG